ncbi:unnamed protein product [Closterium sp. Naga37s-1]|nr:unnamed protein product [Closterium sp. Naga37s-1]
MNVRRPAPPVLPSCSCTPRPSSTVSTLLLPDASLIPFTPPLLAAPPLSSAPSRLSTPPFPSASSVFSTPSLPPRFTARAPLCSSSLRPLLSSLLDLLPSSSSPPPLLSSRLTLWLSANTCWALSLSWLLPPECAASLKPAPLVPASATPLLSLNLRFSDDARTALSFPWLFAADPPPPDQGRPFIVPFPLSFPCSSAPNPSHVKLNFPHTACASS